MRDQCRQFHENLARLKPGQATYLAHTSLAQHLQECSQCQAQWKVHQAMGQAVGGLASPQPRREEEVMRRIRAERQASPAPVSNTPQAQWGRRAVLAAYWLAAAALCFWLLASPGTQAAAWAAARREWIVLLGAPLAALLLPALPFLLNNLRRLFLSLAGAPGSPSR